MELYFFCRSSDSQEQLLERRGIGSFKLHQLACDRVVEAELESMQCQPADGVLAVAILRVAQHRVLQVVHVNANLILSSCLQFQL